MGLNPSPPQPAFCFITMQNGCSHYTREGSTTICAQEKKIYHSKKGKMGPKYQKVHCQLQGTLSSWTSSCISLNEIFSYLFCFSLSSNSNAAAARHLIAHIVPRKVSCLRWHWHKSTVSNEQHKSPTFLQKLEYIIPQLRFFRPWYVYLMEFA